MAISLAPASWSSLLQLRLSLVCPAIGKGMHLNTLLRSITCYTAIIPPAFDYIARLALHQHLQGAFVTGNKIKSAIFYAGAYRANVINDQVVFQASTFDHLPIYAAHIVYRYVIPLSTTAISHTDVLHN